MNKLLIVRHAERLDIAEGEIGDDISITNSGVADCKRFAQDITGTIAVIRTSPVLRCRQTAQVIAKAKNFSQNQITTSRLLGTPGFFIENADLAWNSWLSKGSTAVNEYLIAGTETWPGFYNFDIAVKNIIKEIIIDLRSDVEGIGIWVTHDTVLATLASRVLDEPLTLSAWPAYLGRLDVTLSGENIPQFSYLPKIY